MPALLVLLLLGFLLLFAARVAVWGGDRLSRPESRLVQAGHPMRREVVSATPSQSGKKPFLLQAGRGLFAILRGACSFMLPLLTMPFRRSWRLLVRAARSVRQEWRWAFSRAYPSARRGSTAFDPDRPQQSLTKLLAQHRLLLMSVFLLVVMTTYLYQSHRRLPWPAPGELLLFVHRATSMANGVTPVVPILLIGLTFFCWGHCQLRRLYMRDRWAVDNPCPIRWRFQDVRERHQDLVKDLEHPKRALATKLSIVLWVILFFSFCRLSNHFVPAAEDVVTETVLLLMLAVLTLVIVYGWLHLCKVWGSMRRLLHAITLMKIQEGFHRIPVAITNVIDLHHLCEGHGRRVYLNYQREQHGLLGVEYPRIAGDLAQALPRGAVPEDLAGVMRPCPDSPDEVTARHLSDTARACLKILQHIWDDPRLEERLLKKGSREAEEEGADSVNRLKKSKLTVSGADRATMTIEQKAPPKEAEEWLRKWLVRAEDFVALEMTVYLSQFFVQLRNLTLFLTFAPLLMLLAVTSYPFQPQRLWILLSVALIVLITFSVIWVVIQVERNELVSRILKTTPHRINFHWGFLSHLALYAIPLLGILVAMSSDLSDLVHSWLDPLLRAMR